MIELDLAFCFSFFFIEAVLRLESKKLFKFPLCFTIKSNMFALLQLYPCTKTKWNFWEFLEINGNFEQKLLESENETFRN